MRSRVALCAPVIVFAGSLLLLITGPAAAGPRLANRQLAGVSQVVLTGRVLEATTAWDTSVDAIYTYVTVDVTDVLKGAVPERRVVIKQLGGIVDGLGLWASGQPAFRAGEDVLLFLQVRRRDGTLYTTAQWQGKWTLLGRGASRVAVRANLDAIDAVPSLPDLRPYGVLRAEIVSRASNTGGAGETGGVEPGQPADTTASPASQCPGSLRGSTREVVISSDVCQEINDAGGTLAVGGIWFSAAGRTAPALDNAIAAFVIRNEGAPTGEVSEALDRQLRSPVVQASPAVAVRTTTAGAPPPAAPTGVQIDVNGTSTLTVSWPAVPGALGYRVEFRQEVGGSVLAQSPVQATTITFNIPQGTQGTFIAQVVAIDATGESPLSSPAQFSIGQSGTCTEPPEAPTGGAGYVQELPGPRYVAYASWDPLDGDALWFHVRAWDLVRGNALIFDQNVAETRDVSAEVGAGFRALVRVVALNVCGESPAMEFVVQ